MKRLIYFILLVTLNASAQQQQLQPDHEGSLVKWMSLQEAMKKFKEQPKPIILDFYTDWCGWCKHMMKTTYADPGLAQYINMYFYPAQFDAEGKDTIEFLGKKYVPTSAAPKTPHPLAIELLKGKLMYPTTVFMNAFDDQKKEFRLNMVAAGYLDVAKIEPMLVFSVENVFRSSNFDDFNNNYSKAFRDSAAIKKFEDYKWIDIKTAINNDKKSDKKTLVFISTDWCNSGKVMQRTSFTDSLVEKQIREKFDVAVLNPELTDTLVYKNQQMYPQSNNSPFHQLAFTLTRGNLAFPSLVILDEEKNVLDAIPSYISPQFMDKISHYYGDDIYKTSSWQQFMEKKN